MNSTEVAFEGAKETLQIVVAVRKTLNIIAREKTLPVTSGHRYDLAMKEPPGGSFTPATQMHTFFSSSGVACPDPIDDVNVVAINLHPIDQQTH
jgi:hypothetical protein